MSKKFWAVGAALTLAALALPYGAAYAADEAVPTGAILGGAGAGLLLLRLLEGPARKKGEEL